MGEFILENEIISPLKICMEWKRYYYTSNENGNFIRLAHIEVGIHQVCERKYSVIMCEANLKYYNLLKFDYDLQYLNVIMNLAAPFLLNINYFDKIDNCPKKCIKSHYQ